MKAKAKQAEQAKQQQREAEVRPISFYIYELTWHYSPTPFGSLRLDA
jgi:hypothetical protein